MNKILYTIAGIFLIISVKSQTYITGDTYGGPGITNVLGNFKNSSNELFSFGLYNSTFSFAEDVIAPYGGNADGYLAKYDAAGNQIQAWAVGGNLDDVITAGTVDGEDNIYLTGYFQGSGSNSFDADPGPGDFLLATGPIATRDCFIIKLDSNGDFVNAFQISNPSGGGQEDSFAIATDSENNVYVGGRFQYADFDPSDDGEEILITASGSFEGFLAKYDSDGNFLWVQHLRDAENVITGIAVDESDNVIITGAFSGTINVNLNNTVDIITSNGGRDSFIISYDSTGNFLFSETFGGPSDVVSNVIALTPTNIVVGGYYGPGSVLDLNTEEVAENYGGFDAFISQFDMSGNFISTYTFGGAGNDAVNDLAVDEVNNIYSAGIYTGTTNFDYFGGSAEEITTTEGSVFALLISAENEYLTHGVFNSPISARGGEIEVLSNNTAVCQGAFKTSIDLDPSPAVAIFDTTSIYKCFSSFFSFTNLGTEDVEVVDTPISIYPNPASNFINVKGDDFKFYQIFNAAGKLVQNGMMSKNTPIDIQSLPTGIYLIQLNDETRSETVKFLKN